MEMRATEWYRQPMAFVIDVKQQPMAACFFPRPVRNAISITGETRIIVTVDGTDMRLSPIANVVSKLQALYR